MVSWPMAARSLDSCSSPSNPSGTMLDRVRMAEITDRCREHGVWFVSDESWPRAHLRRVSPTAQFDPHAIVTTASEVLLDDRLRLGWLIMPDPLRVP